MLPLNLAVAGMVTMAVLHAQPGPAVLKFEEASIKPSPNCMIPIPVPFVPGSLPKTAPPPPPPPRPGGSSSGRFNECRPLADFIRMAYVIYADGHFHGVWGSPFEGGAPIEGAPAWVATDPYQILAKAEGTPGREMMSGPILQALLENRFQLKVHKTAKEIPVYALTVAKGGPKLQVSKVDCVLSQPEGPPQTLAPGQQHCIGSIGGPKGPNTRVQAQAASLDTFCQMLTRLLDRPVVNQTGVAGKFDIELAFAIDEATPRLVAGNSDEPTAPSVFTAIQQKLGLKLEPTKGARDFIVIDHVERPSAN
jgi:uncharacterized protein (TIGR03435 family)